VNDVEVSMLARARRGLAPTPADAERVRYSLETALQLAATATDSTNTAPDSLTATKPVATAADRASSAPKTAVATPNAGHSLARWVRVAATLALAASTGAAGYALGVNAGRAHTAPRTTPTAAAPPPPAAPEAVEPSAPVHPVPEPPARSTHARTSKVEAPRASAVPSAAPPAGESSLELETRLLARVERSLRDDNPRLALGLLGELEREVPGGQLEEERQAARVIAHCKLGSESAPKLAADFAARYASSAYRDRIRAACGGIAGAPNGE